MHPYRLDKYTGGQCNTYLTVCLETYMKNVTQTKLSARWLAGILALYAVVFAYSILIAQQLLIAILFGVVLIFLYILWRFLIAIEAIADA